MVWGQVFAVFVAMVCAVLIVRLLLPAAGRRTFDQAVQRQWALTVQVARAPFRGRVARRTDAVRAAQAREATAAAIEQARRTSRASDVARDGNVYTPEAFKGRRKRH